MGIIDLFVKKEMEFDFNLIKTVSGNFDDFKSRLKKSSLIMLIIGKRGSGKTALGFKILESLGGKRRAYYLGKAKLPWWIKQVELIDNVKNNSIVLIDEAAIAYSARESMSKSNKFLSKIMAIARHKNLTLIIITQNSAMLDLNVIRLADTLLFKELSLLQSRFERKSLTDLFKKVDTAFDKIKEKDKKKYFYVIDDEFEGMLTFSLPKFWSEKISKSYADFGK
ncbi:AAA family ATPase [Candidatus Pacearchaeota archaeon]|nr:AAA family ATPase [Candidatus Pacearchaeota archaeon]